MFYKPINFRRGIAVGNLGFILMMDFSNPLGIGDRVFCSIRNPIVDVLVILLIILLVVLLPILVQLDNNGITIVVRLTLSFEV